MIGLVVGLTIFGIIISEVDKWLKKLNTARAHPW